MPNRFSPGCCKNDCPAIELVHAGDWSDWEIVPDIDADGYLEPNTIAEITVSRPDGAWCVDVEILDSAESAGTTFVVDSLARAEILHGNVPLGPGWWAPRDYIQYGNECYTYVISPGDIAWVRIKESYEVEHRSQEIEVWKTDPAESLLSYGGQTASRKPIIDSVPTTVTIRITVCDTRIKIGRVRVLDMAQPTYVGEVVNAKCPTVDLAAPAPHNVVTGVRTVYEGLEDEWAQYTGTGYRTVYDYSGNPDFIILDGSMRVELSSSGLNGSYAWRLYKTTLDFGSPTDTLLTPEEQAEVVAEALSGFIPCDYSYTWKPPTINYSDLVTLDITATNYPVELVPFRTVWAQGIDRLWQVGDYRPFPYSWTDVGQNWRVPGSGSVTIVSLEPFFIFTTRPKIITPKLAMLSRPDDDINLVRSMTFSRDPEDFTQTEYQDKRNQYQYQKPRESRYETGSVYDYNRLEYDQVIVG